MTDSRDTNPAGAACPAAESLLLWAEGFDSPRDTEIAGHVELCASCQLSIQSLEQASIEVGQAPVHAPREAGPFARLRARLAALAAFDLPASLALTTRGAGEGHEPFARAMAEYRAQHLVTAESLLAQCVGKGEGEAAALFFLGACRVALGRPEEALEPLREAVRAEPTLAEYRWNLAQACLQAGLGAEALRELRRIASLPGNRRLAARALVRRIETTLAASA